MSSSGYAILVLSDVRAGIQNIDNGLPCRRWPYPFHTGFCIMKPMPGPCTRACLKTNVCTTVVETTCNTNMHTIVGVHRVVSVLSLRQKFWSLFSFLHFAWFQKAKIIEYSTVVGRVRLSYETYYVSSPSVKEWLVYSCLMSTSGNVFPFRLESEINYAYLTWVWRFCGLWLHSNVWNHSS